jgi:hypothetical protein
MPPIDWDKVAAVPSKDIERKTIKGKTTGFVIKTDVAAAMREIRATDTVGAAGAVQERGRDRDGAG